MYQKLEAYEIRLGNLLKIDQAILENQPLESIAEIAIKGIAELYPDAWISITHISADYETASILAVESVQDSPEWKIGQVVPAQALGDIELLAEGNILEVEEIGDYDLSLPLKDALVGEEVISYMVLPLLSKDKLVGTLHIGKGSVGFHKNEIEMLLGVSAQIAISIAQSKLNIENTKQRNKLATLLEISNALSSSLNLDEVMQLTIDEGTRVLGLETGAFYLVNERELFLGATTPPLPPGFPIEYRIAQLEHHPHIQKAIESSKPVYLADTLLAELTPQERGVSVERGLRSLLYVPLPVDDRVVGVLIMGTVGRTQSFSQDEINLCITFSAQMALAVENARLHSEAMENTLALETNVNERTAELEALTYSISHDLRGPLRAIQGFGEILEEDYIDLLPPEGFHYLERMIFASKRLEGMLDGLLSLRNLSTKPIVLEKLDILDLTGKILDEFIRVEPDRKIESRVGECCEVCRSLYADRAYIELLLTNLLSNAIKFTKNRDVAVVEFGCYEEGDKGVFFIKDNGIGFDPKLESDLYLPFRRLHSESDYPGFGIGMTIVKKIIDLHHGKIWVETERDKGTTVFFSVDNWDNK